MHCGPTIKSERIRLQAAIESRSTNIKAPAKESTPIKSEAQEKLRPMCHSLHEWIGCNLTVGQACEQEFEKRELVTRAREDAPIKMLY